MARDLNPAPRPTAWTTYDELTAEQRDRYGDYVLARDEARRNGEARIRAGERAEVALNAAGGDKAKALAILLGGAR